MKKSLFLVMAVIGLGFLFTGCTKSVVQGGSNGSQAETETFTISPSGWQGSQGVFSYGVNLQSFNQDIHDNGAYWAYISFDNGASYELISTNDNGYTYYATFDKDPNSSAYGVTIQAVGSSTTSPAPNFSVLIKVVSIPSVLMTQSSNVNFHDYSAVKAAFHLSN